MKKLYLDDLRPTPIGWERSFTVAETIRLLDTEHFDIVSLDNDLGAFNEEGYKVADWIEEQAATKGRFKNLEVYCHSDNGPARLRMQQTIESIRRYQNSNEVS